MGNRAGSIPVIRTKNKPQTLDGQRMGLVLYLFGRSAYQMFCMGALRQAAHAKVIILEDLTEICIPMMN